MYQVLADLLTVPSRFRGGRALRFLAFSGSAVPRAVALGWFCFQIICSFWPS